MSADQTAVATVESNEIQPFPLPGRDVLSQNTVAHNVERIEQVVVLPPIFQYAIKRWNQPDKVGITADGYHYLNRAMGINFHYPDFVSDATGTLRRNPIIKPGYILIYVVGIGYNDLGQMISYPEIIETDYSLIYHDARINSRSAKIKINSETQTPLLIDGYPVVEVSPEDELKALKTLSQIRTFGIRYAQTVAKVRILKAASGIVTLPVASPRPVPIKVVGFRDQLRPEERIAQANSTLGAMFGSSADIDDNAGLTSEEIREVQHLMTDDIEEIERELVQAHIESEAVDERDSEIEILERAVAGGARNVSPDRKPASTRKG